MSDRRFPFPCTVVNDRWGGLYSGGRWVAWLVDSEDMGQYSDQHGDDMDSLEFWEKMRNLRKRRACPPWGIGGTPEDAVEDLVLVLSDIDTGHPSLEPPVVIRRQ